MNTSPRALRRQIEHVDDVQRDAMSRLDAQLADSAASRRNFLKHAAIGGAAAATVGGLALPRFAAAQSDDPAVATGTLLAQFEKTAVAIYQAAADAGLIPTGPLLDAAVAFLGHHQAHGQAFATIVGADYEGLAILQPVFDDVVGQATAEGANVLLIAATVEKQAGDTYNEITQSTDTAGNSMMKSIIDANATIAPVEYAHWMVLRSAAEQDIVADLTGLNAFGTTSDSLLGALTGTSA